MSVTDASLNALSDEARTLWTAALALARNSPGVSPRGPETTLPPLLFFTDPLRTPDPWKTAERLPAGAAVVWRHFGSPEAATIGRRLRAVTAERGVSLLIGLDADLATAIGADGVHLPERARERAPDLRTRRPDWLITAAAHAGSGVTATAGLDALVLSPVFETRSPSPARPPLGPEGLADTVKRSALPIYALGGIAASNVSELAGTGACGIAGVEAFRRAFGA